MTDDDKPETTAVDAREVRLAPWLLVLALAAPAFIVFVFPMVSLITRNDEYFAGAYQAGRVVYLLGALTVAVGFVLWRARGTTVGRVAFTCYLLLAPAYVVYALLADMTRSIVLVGVALVIIAVAIAVERWGRATSVRTIAIISVVLLAATTVSTVLETMSPPKGGATASSGKKKYGPAPDIAGRPAGTDLPNVYHVILDEFQSDQFDAALNDPIRSSLQGFTYFPDAMTTYGRTEMALADMYDDSGYDYSIPPVDFVNQALLDPSSGLQQLRAAGYHTTGYLPTRSLWNVPSDPFDDVVLASDAALSDPGADYADLATSMWVDASLPDAVTQRVIPQRHYDQLSTKALLPDDQPAIAVQSFRSFLNREQQEPATGRYTVLHLIIPHKPYVLGADCGYTPGVETDGVAQARCGMALVGELVDELDELGRLDSSTIIVQGDHGAGLERVGDSVKNITPQDYFGVPWSTARSRALILVKPAQADRGEELALSDRPTLTTDVLPTIFDSIDLPIESSDERVSLLADDFPDRPERAYHFYDKDPGGLPNGSVVRFVNHDGELSEGESVTVPTPSG